MECTPTVKIQQLQRDGKWFFRCIHRYLLSRRPRIQRSNVHVQSVPWNFFSLIILIILVKFDLIFFY